MLPASRRPNHAPAPAAEFTHPASHTSGGVFSKCKAIQTKLDATSFYSFFSLGSVCSTFSILAVASIFGIGSVLSVNSLFCVGSINAVLSVNSINSVLSAGCINGFMDNCYNDDT